MRGCFDISGIRTSGHGPTKIFPCRSNTFSVIFYNQSRFREGTRWACYSVGKKNYENPVSHERDVHGATNTNIYSRHSFRTFRYIATLIRVITFTYRISRSTGEMLYQFFCKNSNALVCLDLKSNMFDSFHQILNSILFWPIL